MKTPEKFVVSHPGLSEEEEEEQRKEILCDYDISSSSAGALPSENITNGRYINNLSLAEDLSDDIEFDLFGQIDELSIHRPPEIQNDQCVEQEVLELNLSSNGNEENSVPENTYSINDRGKRHRSESSSNFRICLHCGTENTPQWRKGPEGPSTLCNACGVRFKTGRLLPEYRPAASPTFVATRHSNFHRKVIQLRRKKASTNLEQQANSNELLYQKLQHRFHEKKNRMFGEFLFLTQSIIVCYIEKSC